MATPTTRIGLTKPAGGENKQVAVYNDNLDDIDAAIGIQWVADGALPTKQYDGAIYKELTSGRIFTLKDNGVGGFTPVGSDLYARFTSTTSVANNTGSGVGTLNLEPNSTFPAGAITLTTDTLTISLVGLYIVNYYIEFGVLTTGRSIVGIKEAGTYVAKNPFGAGESGASTQAIVRVRTTPIAVVPDLLLTWGITGNVNHSIRVVRVS